MEKVPTTQPTIESMREYILEGSTPPEAWRTGLELELIGYKKAKGETLERLNYDDIRRVLEAYGGEPIIEDGNTIGSRGNHGTISLEPGGQLEYSSLPYTTLDGAQCALINYLVWLRDLAQDIGFHFIGVGFDPIATLESQHWVPKPRYSIMRPYLGARGARSWDMMTRTAAIQVNVDFEDEQDLGEKFVLGNRLAPIVSAIFSNSPFKEGRLTGFKSERSLVWLEMDQDRSGIALPAIDPDFSIDQFIESAIQTPMFFVRRNGDYIDVSGTRFRDYLSKSEATINDFADHLTTIFTEARVKQWIELRGMDSRGTRGAVAAEALWKGLLYDSLSRHDALNIAPNLELNEFRQLQYEVARDALEAEFAGMNVWRVAREVIEIAQDGLSRIAPDERYLLDEMASLVIKERLTPADILIGNFEGSWDGRIDEAIRYLAI
jgi:Gamma-glutamylcysteine synthetase